MSRPTIARRTPPDIAAIVTETRYLAEVFDDAEARYRLREAAQLEIARRDS